jgi:type VI secretion system protein ImpF
MAIWKILRDMSNLTPSEKLQPCLLDRLTDDDPGNQQESRMQRVISMQRYRQAVLRDLSWLLNTYNNAELKGMDEFEQLPSSVLNYGVRNISGMTQSNIIADDLSHRLAEAIQRFEPRIIASSVTVTLSVDAEEMSGRSVVFEIRGDLWAEPIPEALFIKTELDLESGKTKLAEG